MLASTPTPRAVDRRDLVVNVLDQGSASSCVANANMQAIRMSHKRMGVANPQLGSRLLNYWFSRAAEHATSIDGGTYQRDFLDSLNRFGFCPESKWPYDVSRVNDMPSSAAIRAAYDQHAPTDYRRITVGSYGVVTAVKRALAAGYPVTFGTLVSTAFASDQLGTGPLKPPIGEPIAGGHALCIVGYDGDTFDVVNSWGDGWGAGGYCTFSADYLAWSGSGDFWIVAQPPRYSE